MPPVRLAQIDLEPRARATVDSRLISEIFHQFDMILEQVPLVIIELYDSGAGIRAGKQAKYLGPDCARGSQEASCAWNMKMPHYRGESNRFRPCQIPGDPS